MCVPSSHLLSTIFVFPPPHLFSRGYPETGLEDDDGSRRGPKVTIRETAQEDSYVSKITNATQNVVGRMGSMFGRGLGGFSSKISGGWF